jgi:rod shape-determining protein MreD
VSLRVALGSLLLVLLHLTLHVGFGWGAGAPDLLTLALLLVARELRTGWAALAGLVLGLLEDALSVLAFGATALAMTIVGILGARTKDLFVGDSRLFAVAYLFAGKWMRDLIQWVAVGDELREPFVRSLVVEGGPAAAYVALVGLFVTALLGISWDTAEGR